MVTVVGVRMIMDPAGFIVEYVGRNNKYDGKWEKYILVPVPYLFGDQKAETSRKNEKGNEAMMMEAVTMP